MINYSDYYWEDVALVLNAIPNYQALFNKRILITGSTGMIGSSVVEVLQYLNYYYDAGIRLILAGRDKSKIDKRFENISLFFDYEYIEYDALSLKKINVEADYIIHTASNANPSYYESQPVETLLGNINGLKVLLDTLLDCPTTRLLLVSSSEVYGNKRDSKPYSENDYGYVDILNSRACYPNGKRCAENLCASYNYEYGTDTVIVRPGHIYGPTISDVDNRASAQFSKLAVLGENIVLKSDGAQLRSYCYTLDCASAVLTVLINGEKGEAYNISNKNSVCTIREIAEEFSRHSNSSIVYELPSDKESKGYNLMSNSSLDATKLENLNWQAMFDLDIGTKKTIQYLKGD